MTDAADEGIAVGVDIGGTKTAVGVVHRDRGMLGRTEFPTAAGDGFARFIGRLDDATEQLIAAHSRDQSICGIGIGCPGPLDPPRGLINNPYTLDGWNGVDIVTPMTERFGVPAWLENDADVAAVGEVAAGAGRGGHDPVVMLTFGTGVGGAVIAGGAIYRGSRGEHPEIGHVPVIADGPECYCGVRGCLEAVASGTALTDAAKAAGFAHARELVAAYAAGDERAARVMNRALAAVSNAAFVLVHTFLPQQIVLGGGVMESAAYDAFAGAVRAAIARATLVPKGIVTVARAELGNDAGVIGAAHLALARARSSTRHDPE